MTARIAGRQVQRHHWLGLIALAVVTAVFLMWSTRSVSRPNPADTAMPTPALSEKAAAERRDGVARFSLQCLDRLAKARPREAVKFCTLALQLDARDLTALNLRGNAQMLVGDSKAALADFGRAIALAPGDPSAYRFRANIESVLGRDDAALADYGKAIAVAPKSAVSYELRGQFHQGKRRYALAMADFDRAIAVDTGYARAWNSRCWTQVLMNLAPARALADCDRAIALDPSVANFHDSRGYAHLRLAQYRGAIADFDAALKLDRSLASSWFGRGLAKLRIADRGAAKDLAQARAIEPGIEARFRGYGFRLKAGPAGT